MYEFLWSILHPHWLTAFQKNTFVINFPGRWRTSFPGLSPTRARERDPGKRWSRGSRKKIISEGGVLCLTFFCLVIRDVHAVVATAR